MSLKPISVKREQGYIIVDSLSPDGPKTFGDIGSVVIALRKYHEQHASDFPKNPFEIKSELYEGPDGEGVRLKSNLKGLYSFAG
jgi:hypothetical protein